MSWIRLQKRDQLLLRSGLFLPFPGYYDSMLRFRVHSIPADFSDPQIVGVGIAQRGVHIDLTGPFPLRNLVKTVGFGSRLFWRREEQDAWLRVRFNHQWSGHLGLCAFNDPDGPPLPA